MKRVVIFGGNGFVGTAIKKRLSGFEIVSADRFPKGSSKQVDITKISEIQDVLRKGDIVINLVGLSPLRKPKGTTYYDVHVLGVKNIVSICKKKRCKLIHMSALGANKKGITEYLRTKGLGEEIVLRSGLKFTVFCPSIIFGNNCELMYMLKRASKFCFFPNIPSKVQPVFVDDIAKLFELAVKGKIREKKLEVGGEEEFSMFELCKLYAESKGRKLFPIPISVTKPGIFLASIFGFGGMSLDNIRALNLDNVTNKNQDYIKLKQYSAWVKKNAPAVQDTFL